MKLLLAAVLILTQTPPAEKPWWEQGVKSAKQVWTQVQKQGQPYAEKLAKESQVPLKKLRVRGEAAVKQMTALHKEVAKVDWAAKKDLVVELWRMRASLDLASLLNPQTFEQLTGMKLPEFSALKTQFDRQWKRLFPDGANRSG